MFQAVSNNAAYLTIAVTSYHATMPFQTVETRPLCLIVGLKHFCAVEYAVGLVVAFVTHDHTQQLIGDSSIQVNCRYCDGILQTGFGTEPLLWA